MKQLKARLKIVVLSTLGVLFAIFLAFSIQNFRGGPKIVVGAKNCTEQLILGEILSQLIESETELKVVRKFNLEGTTICFNALKSKTIDLYVEYTGTALFDILKESIPEGGLYDYVKSAFESKYGIVWLDRLGFSNQYVLIVRKASGLKKISDLKNAQNVRVAFDPEFAVRLEPRLLAEHYQGTMYQKLMDQVLLYFSLSNHSIDVISGFSTDGRLKDETFLILEDDQGALPTYEAAPMITKTCLDKYPELQKVLQKLKGAISTSKMSQMNYQLEVERRDVKVIAAEFLSTHL